MIIIKDLTCEYKKNPVGIDVLKPRISWKLEGNERGVMQSAYEIQVSKEEDTFEKLSWATGKVQADRSIHIEYEGEALESRARYYYRVRVWNQKDEVSEWSGTAFFEMGLLKKEDWKAKWITHDFVYEDEAYDPCPLFRRDFTLGKGIKKARAYATSLGLYELYINGERVSDNLFTPGWTSYNKRLQYQTYEVTDMLLQGRNAVGIVSGNGWYKGNLAWQEGKNIYGDTVAVLMQLNITYEDDSEEVFITDGNWKSSTGPILMSEIYHGEIYDASLEKEGWSCEGYDESTWFGVKNYETEKYLVAQENVPVKRIEEIRPVGIFTTPAGETVMDMGQNMVGWIKLKVRGKSGEKVVLKHAEVLDKDGNFYTANLRNAKQTIEYILKGEGEEVYEPHFTFQGFRYVKIEEYPGTPVPDDFTGVVLHSDMEQTGSFECSEKLVNQLQHNILWGQKGNFLDVPTDCPQRDERLGWTGDAQVFVRTSCFIMNTAPFFTKWLRDLKADQTEEGGIPYVIPQVLAGGAHSSAAWGDAAVICPWTIYLCFGDKRVIEEQYESMKAWIEYIRLQGDNEYLWNTGFHFGDWLGLDSPEGSYIGATARDFIATAFYAYSTSLLIKAARILNKQEDVNKYENLYRNVLEAFRKEFVTPNGRLAVPTQTAHVLALMFDLVEEKDSKRTADTLAEYIKENKYHLATGFVGTPYLCHVLSENGHLDTAYKLLLQQDYPSWLYQVTKGATTIWEHWDGIKPDGSFWSADMNSFNHYAYGAIGDWLYRTAAGLNIDEAKPAYKHIIVKPQPGTGIDYVKAQLESLYGTIKSEWKNSNDTMEMVVKIPANTTATVELPGAVLEELQESGRAIAEAEGITAFVEINGASRLQLGSGEYFFKYKMVNCPIYN
jgi:alpha-L-rhamnosidase